MSASYTFKWPAGPNEVILTGTFDNWAKTLPLVKQADGSFELTVPLPAESQKLYYKYVVDGEWLVAPDQRLGKDDSGIDNNVLEREDLISSTSFNGSRIPEAGGLVSAVAPESVKTTVMPVTKDEPTITGEPGLQIPKDAAAISAFTEINEVDGQKFNEEMTAEEKKKQKKKVKRSQYKAKKKKKAQEAVVNGGDSNSPVGSSAQETSDAEFGSPEPEIPGTFPAAESPSSDAFAKAKEEAESKDAPLEADSVEQSVSPNADKEVFPTTLDPRVKAPETISEVKPLVAEEIPQPIVTDEAPEPLITGEVPEQVEVNKSAVEPAASAEIQEPVAAEAEMGEVEDTKASEPSTEEKETDPAIVAAIAASTVAAGGLAATEAGKIQQPTELKGVAPEPIAEKALDAEPKAVAAPAIASSAPVAAEDSVTPEPVAAKADAPVDDAVEKEVDASPVKNLGSAEEEIFIAHGNADEIAAAIVAQEGDVTVEEFKPTDDEAARLAEEVKATSKPAASTSNKEKKKSGRFSRFIKKIFK